MQFLLVGIGLSIDVMMMLCYYNSSYISDGHGNFLVCNTSRSYSKRQKQNEARKDERKQ